MAVALCGRLTAGTSLLMCVCVCSMCAVRRCHTGEGRQKRCAAGAQRGTLGREALTSATARPGGNSAAKDALDAAWLRLSDQLQNFSALELDPAAGGTAAHQRLLRAATAARPDHLLSHLAKAPARRC